MEGLKKYCEDEISRRSRVSRRAGCRVFRERRLECSDARRMGVKNTQNEKKNGL